MLKKIYITLKTQGVNGVLNAARNFVAPQRAHSFDLCQQLTRGKNGLEVGGPSGVFATRGLLPLYSVVASLDNCNFAAKTTWEGYITEGKTFRFSKEREPGMQYVAEATNLNLINSESYDFVLSSHAIEHTANPIRCLTEWIRVIKVEGALVLLIPHKDATFDHCRPVTTLDHLLDDFNRNVGEDDLTHLAEILQLHDLKLDPAAGTLAAFRLRSEANLENRCLHQHVFDTRLAVSLLDRMGLKIRAAEAARPNHIIVVAQKIGAKLVPDNSEFLTDKSVFLGQSPFPTDRRSASMSSSVTS